MACKLLFEERRAQVSSIQVIFRVHTGVTGFRPLTSHACIYIYIYKYYIYIDIVELAEVLDDVEAS